MSAGFAWPDPIQLAADSLEKGTGDPRSVWLGKARHDQLPPSGAWRYWLITGGRGSGKTATGSNTLGTWILNDEEPGEWGVIAPTYRDAWTTCICGESGLLAAFGTTEAAVKLGKSKYIKSAYRSHGEVTFRNGHLVRADSANDGALRVQGKNLKGAWVDELGLFAKWRVAWDESIDYAVRQGIARIVATGTPKVSRPAAKLIRRLINHDKGVIHTRLLTRDNVDNLSPSFFDNVVARATGTRLEKQELEGLLLEDVEGALWTRELLEAIVVDGLPAQGASPGRLQIAYVGVDPSDGSEVSDEQAYTVTGKIDGKLYVVESFGEKMAPVPFLKRCVQAAVKWNAELVVEKNHGGAYLIETLLQVMKDMRVNVPYRVEHAGVGKLTRAEPVAALYERGVVRHVHWTDKDADGNLVTDESMVELEDQMATWTGLPDPGSGTTRIKSPDRMDSLVWSCLPFLRHTFETTGVPGGPKRYRALEQLDATLAESEQWARKAAQMRDRIRPRTLDGEPDDDLLQRMPSSRPNVREYRYNQGML